LGGLDWRGREGRGEEGVRWQWRKESGKLGLNDEHLRQYIRFCFVVSGFYTIIMS